MHHLTDLSYFISFYFCIFKVHPKERHGGPNPEPKINVLDAVEHQF